MRCRAAAPWGIMLGMIVGIATTLPAQGPVEYRRPKTKVMTFQAPTDTSAVVGVMGQVRRPGTYQFGGAPTLDLVIASAEGLTSEASPMIRVIRGQRVALRVAYPQAAQEKLQSGDLVIIDPQPTRSGSVPPAVKKGVWLALLGVQDQPLIVLVETAHAHADLVLQKLNQPKELLPSVRLIAPPTKEFDGNRTGSALADGSVLIFDHSLIREHELPNDLPQILPCSVPEPDNGPEIGGYGVRNAYEERMQQESETAGSFPRRTSQKPDRFQQVPLPTPDAPFAPAPTPIPLPLDQPAATFSSTGTSTANSPTISTVPFSESKSSASRRNRLTGAAPTLRSSAADTQTPAWKKVARSPIADDSEVEAARNDAERVTASGAFSAWQMLVILSSAGLLIGSALAVRAMQQDSSRKSTPPASIPPRGAPPADAVHLLRTEVRAPIPAPHIPLAPFRAASARIETPMVVPTAESLVQRQQRFAQILNNELPVIEEPLALRPGIRLGAEAETKSIWRKDAASLASPARAAIPVEHESPVPSPRQHLDAPHPRISSGPHLRVGPEAPVERALRQLQGGRS